MNDTEEGSSSAAQRAQNSENGTQTGIFGRIAVALNLTKKHSDNLGSGTSMPSAMLSHTPEPGMVNLRRMRVEDVAIPKADIISVPSDIRKDDLVAVFRESGLTRIPVYKGTLDTPIGLVHLKDLALRHGFNGKGPRFDLQKLVRPVLFAPPSMPIGILLQKMQNDRIHMALVVDEYGGVDGLVTIENLIEQVIGEIEDEHDIAEGSNWILENPGCYLADAKTPLDLFEKEVGLQLLDPSIEDEIDTVGGLVIVLSGRVPTRGECISHPNGLEFEVVDADPRRLKRLRIRLPNMAADG
ncbi:MAG: hemolysin family protein [Paracoccaceae bacterium]